MNFINLRSLPAVLQDLAIYGLDFRIAVHRKLPLIPQKFTISLPHSLVLFFLALFYTQSMEAEELP